MKDIRAIRDDADLAWAIAEVEHYFDHLPVVGGEDAERFDVLSDLIEAYENRRHPVEAPDPVDLIRAHMDLTGRTQADLATLLGSRSRASEVLNRRRALTVEMIHRLATAWGLPAECLVMPYRLAAA